MKQTFCIIWGLVCFVGSGFVYPVAKAQSTSDRPSRVEASQDTFIVLNNQVGHDENGLSLASVKSGGRYRTDTRILVNFDVSQLPDDSPITNATLKLTFVRPIGSADEPNSLTDIYLYRQDTPNWSEDAADWFSTNATKCTNAGGPSCWKSPGADFVYSPGVPERQVGTYVVSDPRRASTCNLGICTLEFDATDFVGDAITNRSGSLAMAIRSESQEPLSARFYSAEVAEIDYRPVVELRYAGDSAKPSCAVDITLVIDNSGSMDDHGADVNLRALSANMKDYFREDYDVGRASLYWFSADRKGRLIVSSEENDSLRRSLDTMRTAKFNYDGSDFRQALKVATERAIANEQAGRTQFIFFAGDEQTDYPDISPPNPYWDLIAQAGRKGVTFYTFDLRPGAKNSIRQPYKYIADRSGGKAFRGAHFNDDEALKKALSDDSCKIVGVKFNDLNGNGQRDAGEPGLGGWTMRLHSDDATGETFETTTRSDSDRPGYYEFTRLNKNQRYWVEEVMTADQLVQKWRQTTQPESSTTAATLGERPVRDIGNMRGDACVTNCTPDPQEPKVTTAKSVSRSVITGTQTTTDVTVSARILDAAVTKFKLTEKLAPGFVFGSNPDVKGVYIDGLTGNRTEFILNSLPPQAGQSDDWVIEPKELNQVFQPGLIEVSFQLRYIRTQNGSYPVDLIVAGQCEASSRVEYQSTTSNTLHCATLPPGEITRRNFALSILGDALFQDKNTDLVFDGQSLKVGQNSLVILGGSTSSGVPLTINNYDVPVSGKLHWQSIWNELNQRIDRSRVTTAQEITCPGRLDGNVYLETEGSNISEPPQNPLLTRPRVWIIPASAQCRLVVGSITIHGVGTIVNLGGVTQFEGKITGSSTNSVNGLAVISSLDPTRSQRGSGEEDIIILDQAEPNLTALITNGRLVIAKRDAAVTDDSRARAVDYTSYLIGSTLRFPKRGSLRADISIRPADNLKQSVPPLLDHIKLPTGKSLQ